VKVNVLTGSGSITNTYSGSGTDILTVASGNFAGPIGGSGDGFSGEGQGRTGLTKVSPGTLMLGGASTYAGPTSVTAGTLLVDGSIASPVTVTGGTLGGGGSIAGNVDIQTGGSISAGDSPGHLTIDGQYSQTGHMLVEISGLDRGLDPGYDWIQVTGGHGAAVDGPVDIQLLGGFMPASGDAFDVLTAADIQVGPGFSLNGPPLLPAQYWDYRIVDPWPGPGGGMALEVFVGVPEPASLLLAMVGLAGFLACAGSCRRKWKSH